LNARAFTLIELLIVVAIIAILAAVAVPNLLEAQTRSKVARVRSDMRTLATGLEAYRMDNTMYPPPTGNGIPTRLNRLSSPIPYLVQGRLDQRNGTVAHELEYWGCNEERTALSSTAAGDLIETSLGGGEARVSWYFLRSSGPDNDINTNSAGYQTWLDPGALATFIYDPTNGTVSFGEIYRAGGDIGDKFRPSARLLP
jgi:prepilin-type N-terminal cleavage/methylation domain-containing protein